MAQRIEVPGMGIVEFPDGMTDDQITAAIQANMQQDVPQSGVVEDVVKSTGTGLAKGGLGLAGMRGDVAHAAMNAGEWLASKVGIPQDFLETTRPYAESAVRLAGGPRSQDLQRMVEQQTGDFYKPQTKAGRYAQTVAEFIPGALIPGGGGVASRVAKFGVLPGVTSEAAGQAVEGSWAEPYVRGSVAVATGGVAALASSPRTAATTVRGAMEGVTPQQLDQAENLFMEAQRAGQPITRAEAIQYVTGGATRMGDVQRVVEGQGGMREFFAPRPAQNEQAFGGAVRGIDPTPTPQPSTIGPTAGRAAEGIVDDMRGAINTASEPFYTAASTVRLTPTEMARVRALPGYAEARDAVRNDPQLARYVAGLPEDSVGFLNEVKKYLDQAAENAAGAMNAQRNQQRAAGYGSDAAAVRQVATDASPDYATALGIQQQARERYLQPLLDGPIGRLASRDTTTQAAINALFPANPIPNSAGEIATAVTALSARNPGVARQLVRAHVESVFNEGSQNLISGPNQFGGAKFAAAIRGNPQQAANLEAAIRALPNGDQVWTGFDRFLQIVEAQGTRQRIGSQTAFNTEALQDLRRGTPIQEIGQAASTGGLTLPTRVRDALERWRLGRGVDEIAGLLTSPEAAQRFRRIAELPSGGRAFAGNVARLVYLAYQTRHQSSEKRNRP
jgi:hypothetical protein